MYRSGPFGVLGLISAVERKLSNILENIEKYRENIETVCGKCPNVLYKTLQNCFTELKYNAELQ